MVQLVREYNSRGMYEKFVNNFCEVLWSKIIINEAYVYVEVGFTIFTGHKGL
jgi:hypothetical protein